MSLLDWIKGPEETSAGLSKWAIPVRYTKWGTFTTVATDKDEAIAIWHDLAGDEAERDTVWDGLDELEIDWCGSIERIDE